MNSTPSQNCGRQQQMFAVTVTIVSASLPRFTALTIANTTPSGMLMKNDSDDKTASPARAKR